MKRVDLVRQIEGFGCVLIRHGGKHDWYRNPNTGVSQPVPRHREIIGKSRKGWRAKSSGPLKIPGQFSATLDSGRILCAKASHIAAANGVASLRRSEMLWNQAMNLDLILETFNRRGVACLLIGGMNFLLRHAPITTFDVDLWIDDRTENRRRCEQALAELGAEWGLQDADWGPVELKAANWLDGQGVFCLASPHGAIDVFRYVSGLDDWSACHSRAISSTTAAGTPYHGISDEDMLSCQLALSDQVRNHDRIARLRKILGRTEP